MRIAVKTLFESKFRIIFGKDVSSRHEAMTFLSSLLSISGSDLLNSNDSQFYITFYIGNASEIKNLGDRVIWIHPYTQITSSDLELVENKVLAIFDPTVNPRIYTPMVTTLFQLTDLNIEKWNREFTELLEQNLGELQRIKKIHERVVPVREHKFRSGKIYSKYSAGTLSGGDFFDIIQTQNDLLILLSSTHSYLVSSIVMAQSALLRKREKIDFPAMDNFVKALHMELTHKNLKFEKDELSGMLLLKINLKDLTCDGYLMGHTELMTTERTYYVGANRPVDPAFLTPSKISFKLERNEHLLLISPGIRKNLKGFVGGEELVTYLKKRAVSKRPSELLNELFFELKRDISDEEMLKYDSTILFFEVDPHAILTL